LHYLFIDEGILIASGGDDNGLVIHKIQLSTVNNTTTVKVLEKYMKQLAHAAQITGTGKII